MYIPAKHIMFFKEEGLKFPSIICRGSNLILVRVSTVRGCIYVSFLQSQSLLGIRGARGILQVCAVSVSRLLLAFFFVGQRMMEKSILCRLLLIPSMLIKARRASKQCRFRILQLRSRGESLHWALDYFSQISVSNSKLHLCVQQGFTNRD